MGKRIPQLDGLRACAILAVFLHHAFGVRMLWMGVDVFFVLSGFLITGILLEMKRMSFRNFIAEFYARRLRRIMPPYILFLVIVTMFFGTVWMRHWYLFFGLTNFTWLFKGGYFPPVEPLWSLGVEEQFYVVWPLAVYFFSERSLPALLIGMLVAIPALRGVATIWAHGHGISLTTLHWFIYKTTPLRMDCMVMGALITFAWRRYRLQIRQYGYLALTITASMPVLMLILSHHQGWSTMDGTLRGNVLTYEISLLAATGAFLWALGGRFTWILTNGVMRYIGKISYSFYLIHMCGILLAQRYFHRAPVAGLVALAGSIGYAALSWRFLEQPILHGGNRRIAAVEASVASEEGVRGQRRRVGEPAA